MEQMYAALCECMCTEKKTFSGKDDSTIAEWGDDLHSEGCTRPELTQADGRLPSMEDNPRWKTSFDGRLPLMENDL